MEAAQQADGADEVRAGKWNRGLRSSSAVFCGPLKDEQDQSWWASEPQAPCGMWTGGDVGHPCVMRVFHGSQTAFLGQWFSVRLGGLRNESGYGYCGISGFHGHL